MDDVNLTPSQSAGPESSGMTEVGLALHATDFLIAPAWVISGVLLWLGLGSRSW
jgi:hypothetical protein